MSTELRDPAQDHIDAIHRFTDFLIDCCADRFTVEMQEQIDLLLASFAVYRGQQPKHPYSRDVLFDRSLEHNYITAQCGTLLAFAHEVMALSPQPAPLASPVQWLRRKLAVQHDLFFNEANYPEDPAS